MDTSPTTISRARHGAVVLGLDVTGLADLFEMHADGVAGKSLGPPGEPDPAMYLETARRLVVAGGLEAARHHRSPRATPPSPAAGA